MDTRTALRHVVVAGTVLLAASSCTGKPEDAANPGAFSAPEAPPFATTTASPGTLRLWLTDIPMEGVDAVNVTISRIDVVHTTDLAVKGDVITVSDEVQTHNLLDLQGGIRAPLGLAELPVGFITQFRLIVTDAEIVIDGEASPIFIPSGVRTGIKLVGEVQIFPGATTDVVFDFDAEKSVIENKGQGFILKPVITFQVVPDTTGPGIFFIRPEFLVQPSTDPLAASPPPPPAQVTLESFEPTVLDVKGIAADTSGIASITLFFNGVDQAITVASIQGGKEFSATVQLLTGGPDYSTINLLRVEATDNLGNLSIVTTIIEVLNTFHPSRLVIRFDGRAGQSFIDDVIAELNGSIQFADLTSNLFVLDVDISEPIVSKAIEPEQPSEDRIRNTG